MKWKNMSPIHKLAAVVAALAAVAWLIFEIKPNLLGVDAAPLAIALFTVCEAVIYWREKRKWAILLLVAAVICAASFAAECLLLSPA